MQVCVCVVNVRKCDVCTIYLVQAMKFQVVLLKPNVKVLQIGTHS